MSNKSPQAEIVIRPANGGEAELLSKLALRSKAHWGYSKEFIRACRKELTYGSDYLRKNPVFVAEADGTVVGFYTLERVSKNEAELGAMFVEPDCIGLGFGRALISHAKKTASMLGIGAIVIQGDPNAVNFYQAAGATLCGERESGSVPGRMLPLFRIAL